VELRSSAADAVGAELLCERIAATGALEDAREQALAYVCEAKSSLDPLDLSEARRRPLDLVADAVVERYA
jgi:geranylgeranyl pyrophosphate synthase